MLAAGVLLALTCFLSTQAQSSDAEPLDKASLGSPDFQPSPDHPIGWRGDGGGRYPAAEPPVAWGRLSTAVKDLSTQARKPGPG
jgi:hypothetical protein